jgi:membrane fusion protein (multidrug efflux system)
MSTFARLSVLFLLAAGCDPKPAEPAKPPPPEVNVARPLQRDVPIHLEVIGETRGNTEIEVRARVEGFIETVEFAPGSMVKKGDLLYTLDPRPFEAALAKARGAHAEVQAQEARARQDVARYAPLVEKNAISRQLYETSVAVEKAATAAVAAAAAEVESAQIDLSYTKVLAPEDGLVGKTEVYAGTLVGRGQSTLLTRISRIDPIHARASIAERDYLAIAQRVGAAEQTEKKELVFTLLLADGSVYRQTGKLVFLDRNVDPRTGTIMFEAAFPNPQRVLRPGQYARVRCQMDVARGALLVPQRAVQELQGAYHVLVVGADGVLAQRLITTAERVGSLWRVPTGLQAEDQVVVDGVQKVRPGMQVVAKTVSIDPDAPGSPGAPNEEQSAKQDETQSEQASEGKK